MLRRRRPGAGPFALATTTVVVVLLLLAGRAHAVDVLERYEDALVAAALARHGLTVDPQPEGKQIEAILIQANQVLLHGDFGVLSRVPVLSIVSSTFLNKLHVRTRDYVIAQELLFHVGDRYRTDVVEESGRNLRRMFILSVARIVAVQGSAPDRVRMLVVTKDQWSLRLNTDFTIDQTRLDFLAFSVSEMNLAGRNKTVNVDFALDPGRYTVGAGYADPRILGSRHALTLGADLFLDRRDSSPEGATASLTVGRPLYSLRTKWAWAGAFSFVQDKVRFFRGGDLDALKVGSELIPEVYARRVISGSVAGTRSWGLENKLNLSGGYRVDSARYGLTSDFPANASDLARQAFLASLPRSEDSDGPYVTLNAYHASYIRLVNIDTFALTEDYRLGPTAAVSARYAIPLGFSSHFLELSASYGSVHRWHDDLFSYAAGAAARIQTDVLPGRPGEVLVNEEVDASIRNVSPRFGPFRLHVYGGMQLRNHDLNHVRFSIGSDSGLRGFAPREFQGNSRYEVNVELRTLPLNLWTLHVGAVAFYDGGDAPVSLLTPGWHQDAGVGVRILFPQFNRDVLRLDLAFPFEPILGGYVPRFSAEFGQAF
jgi:hypothetical protein